MRFDGDGQVAPGHGGYDFSYDTRGKRCHTTYIAAAPEHGKETFKKRLKHEMDHVFELYPSAKRIGIADGAADNWEFLEKYTLKQTLDFYHATEYGADVANCLFYSDELRQKWVENRWHQLKPTKPFVSYKISIPNS